VEYISFNAYLNIYFFLFQPAKDLMVLSVLSIVGCGISILFLVITVFVHALLWRYSSKIKLGLLRTKIATQK
jgi:hypothetical protein